MYKPDKNSEMPVIVCHIKFLSWLDNSVQIWKKQMKTNYNFEKINLNLSDVKGAAVFASNSWFTCCKPSSSVTVIVQDQLVTLINIDP